jgi:hypothetical protein
MHPEQVLLLAFPSHEWLHILTGHNIYASIQSGLINESITRLLLGERIIAKKG